MDYTIATEDEIRGFLRLCLEPRPGHTRPPEALAQILPGPLRDRLHRFSPRLAGLHAEADRAAQEARAAADRYSSALAAWIAGAPDGLCTQNGHGDNAAPQPHVFAARQGGPARCLFCAIPAGGIIPGYRTTGGLLWTLAPDTLENGTPLYQPPTAPSIGYHTAEDLAELYGQADPVHEVEPPAYVFNARSVNRRPGTAVKHLYDGIGLTICPRAFEASAPMPPEEAALLPLCGGCRDAALDEAGLPAA